jgi:hypothetical protein
MLALVLKAVDRMVSGFDPTSFVLIVGLPLVVTLFTSRLRQWLRLHHIPGPPFAGLSRWFWLAPLGLSGQKHIRLQEVNRKYGK